MRSDPAKVVILNNPAAADVASSGGIISITGLPPIATTEWKEELAIQPYQAEVAPKQTLAIAATLVAATRYAIAIDTAAGRDFGHTSERLIVAARTPVILVGAGGAADKHNLYHALAHHINNTPTLKKYIDHAYPVVTLTHAAGTLTVGATATGATSGAKGVVLASASGTATIGMQTAIDFAPTENVTDGTGTFATIALTKGVGLRIIFKAGFYNIVGSPKGAAPSVLPGQNVLTSDITTNTAGVIGFGSGQSLVDSLPQYDRDGRITKGYQEFRQLNQQPVAGTNYNRLVIRIKKSGDSAFLSDEMRSGKSMAYPEYHIYANKDAANYAAFASAINAL